MHSFQKCPICKNERDEVQLHPIAIDLTNQIHCKTCGEYRITHFAMMSLQNNQNDYVKISCYLRERTIRRLPIITITPENFRNPDGPQYPHMSISEIEDFFPKTISERLDRALMNLSKLSEFTGAPVTLLENDYPVFFPDNAKDLKATYFIMGQLLEEGLIKGTLGFKTELTVTSKGWNRIYEMETQKPDSNQGFIAMSFSRDLDSIWKNGIERAIISARYDPLRVSESETNGKICDEIIMQIRRSKFVVADFTYQRNGVYFEAGFAMGLGIPVIWTCKKQEIEDGKLHFDTRQYNHIDWTDEEELYIRLLNRIKANIV